jgi:hypothetical protein
MNADETVEAVLADIKALIVAHFGDTFTAEDIQVEADVFEGGELDVGAGLRIAEQLDRIACGPQQLFQVLVSHASCLLCLDLVTACVARAQRSSRAWSRDGAWTGSPP